MGPNVATTPDSLAPLRPQHRRWACRLSRVRVDHSDAGSALVGPLAWIRARDSPATLRGQASSGVPDPARKASCHPRYGLSPVYSRRSSLGWRWKWVVRTGGLSGCRCRGLRVGRRDWRRSRRGGGVDGVVDVVTAGWVGAAGGRWRSMTALKVDSMNCMTPQVI